MKKLLSIILAILMIVSSVPFAFAADETPPTREIDGEVYYELDSAEDYLWFVQMCNDSVNPDEPDYEYEDDFYYTPQKDYYIPYNAILTDDIVINSNVIVDGELTSDTASLIEVDPIAKYYEEPETYSYNTSYYTGTFDGNGYSISGLYMCNTDREYAMFRKVHNDGVIKNLHIKDSYFTGDRSIAALVGSNKGTISGCSFDGIVYTTSNHAGGLVSINSGLIENSYNAGHIHSSGHQNAGIAISNNGTIRNCYNTGTIGNTTGASQTGGITGDNSGSIENCYNIGEILGVNNVAAISSGNQPDATITNCYFNCDDFSGQAVYTNYNESGTTNVEGKTAAEFADAVVCDLVGYHGYVNSECVACGVSYEHEHTTNEQTCMGYKCKYCGIYHGEAAPDNHTYGIYNIVIEAGCESEGLEKAFCVHCGVATLERSIPETGHSWQNKDGVCANNCGTVCEHPEDKLAWTEIVAANCVPGQEKANCTYCGYEGFIKSLCDSADYPESLHDYASNSNETWDFSSEGAKKLLLVFSEKTFTENNFDYIYLYDGNGTEIGKYTDNQLAGAEIEIEGDSFSMKLTSDGSLNKYGFSFDAIYSVVNDPEFVREIPAPHNIVNVEAQAKTCTTVGWDAYEYCTDCDYTTYVEIPATNHKDTLVQVDAQAPTCEDIGWDAYEYCTACDYSTYEEIPSNGHTEETVKGYAATCTETGLSDGVKCSACGDTLTAQEVIPSNGHTEETVKGYAATCTETGLSDGVKCSVCGDTLTEQTVISAKGHADANGDGVCDNGGEAIEKQEPDTPDDPSDEPTDDTTNDCDHLCHKSGFMGFIWKIVRFFQKLFGIQQYCDCGITHW